MKIALYGAGGHGKVVGEIALLSGHEIVSVIDEKPKELFGCTSVPLREFLSSSPTLSVVLGIGSNKVRQEAFLYLKEKGYNFPVLVHPSAVISPDARLGEGSVVMACSVVNKDALIGCGVILNTSCVVEHDSVVGDFVHVSPKAVCAGSVEIGLLTHVGAAACIIEGMRIGSFCVIGAGSVVINHIEDHKKVVGNPAKKELS